MKRFDLMFGVNVRGTYCCTQACLPELIKAPRLAARNAEHEPALSMREHWFKATWLPRWPNYGMADARSPCRRVRPTASRSNSLWSRTPIATAARR